MITSSVDRYRISHTNTISTLTKEKLNKITQFQISKLFVNSPAVLPDLTFGSGERSDISHLDHGLDKIRSEGVWVATVGAHYGISGPTIEKLLIRVEQSLLDDEVLEVVVVKKSWSPKIKRC